jgi:hypothetical protein
MRWRLYTDFCADRKCDRSPRRIKAALRCSGKRPCLRPGKQPAGHPLKDIIMRIPSLLLIAAATLALGACGNTVEQRIGGAAVGAGTGAVVAGPIGAVVGGAAGAVSGPSVARATRRATR